MSKGWDVKIASDAKRVRVIYTLVLNERIMNIVVISERDDNYCYDLAMKAYKKHGDKIFEDIFDDLR